MQLNSFLSSTDKIALTIFASFVFTSSLIVTVIVCCGKKKKAVDGSERERSTMRGSEQAPRESGGEEGNEDEPRKDTKNSPISKSERKSKSKKEPKLSRASKNSPVDEKRVTSPKSNRSTVQGDEYGTMGGVGYKIVASIATNPKKPIPNYLEPAPAAVEGNYVEMGKLADGKGTGGTVPEEKYQTMLGTDQKITASRMAPGGAKVAPDPYQTITRTDQKMVASKLGKGTGQVGAKQYETMANVNQQMGDSMKAKGKGKVGPLQYQTMAAVNQKMGASVAKKQAKEKKIRNAAAGFAPKKAEEQYNTLFGVNDRMNSSKQG